MTYLIEFSYESEHRDKIQRFLDIEGLADTNVEVTGAWLAAQTGVAYAIIEATTSSDLYQACARWSDYGELKVTPLVPVTEI